MKRHVTFDTGDTMYHTGLKDIFPNIITGGDPSRIRKIAQYFDKVYDTVASDRGVVTVHGWYQGIPISAFTTQMGPSSVDINLPEALEASDSVHMNIIRVGTSGGLNPKLKPGDLIVTDHSVHDEGVSRKIMGPDFEAYADKDAIYALEKAAGKHKLPFQSLYTGETKTTDEIYWGIIEDRKKPNHGPTLAVSMEFSVIAALRDKYNHDFGKNIRAGELLMVSDMVVGKESGPVDMTEFLSKKDEVEKAQILSGLDALVFLANNKMRSQP